MTPARYDSEIDLEDSMNHTYQGTRIPFDWMPEALANGIEDERTMPAFDRSNLYRWSAPVSRALYRIGRWVGRIWSPWEGGAP